VLGYGVMVWHEGAGGGRISARSMQKGWIFNGSNEILIRVGIPMLTRIISHVSGEKERRLFV